MLSAKSIKQRASELGFIACGLARAEAVSDDAAAHFDHWIAEGCHASMLYMERHRPLRLDPRQLHPDTCTVISFALPYWQPNDTRIATYALGSDYHDIMRQLLQQMGVEGRICVDTAPILEKYWAAQAGIGWIGRHHQLVIPHKGSAFFLGEILSTDTADQYDTPVTGSQCGTCHACVDACPTGALCPDGHLDARRCLSYLTIEHRGDISLLPPTDQCRLIYGCDRCLRACPHGKNAPQQTHFAAKPELKAMTDDDWRHLMPEQFASLFRGSAVKRTKYEGLMRNIGWVL